MAYSPQLTEVQIQRILSLKTEGKSSRQIARILGISKNVAWRVMSDTLVDFIPVPKSVPVDERLFNTLSKSKRKWTVDELSDHLDIGVGKVRNMLQTLKDQGKNIQNIDSAVELVHVIAPSEPLRIDISKFKGRRVRFGLTSDNHLGSKYARMEVLEALYDIWEEQGITDVYQCGNMIDGDARFNRFDLLVHGMEAQANYFAEHWPRRKGMQLHFITGDDHEGWYVQREGVIIGEYLEYVARKHGRTDMHYLGHMERDIVLEAPNGSATMRLIHGGGGTAYAISYTVQQIINSYTSGEKPNILLVGHYHKAEFISWREVLSLQAGCTEDQTPFMRKLKLQAHVGGWTVEFDIDNNGIVHDFTTRWHPFYDRKFYENKQWGYKWDQRSAEDAKTKKNAASSTGSRSAKRVSR